MPQNCFINSPDAILLTHAFSGDAHAAGYHAVDDRKPGWWDRMIGWSGALPGRSACARAFNGNISGWNVSAVTNMSEMFSYAIAFNQNLEEWKAHWTPETGNKLDAKSYLYEFREKRRE